MLTRLQRLKLRDSMRNSVSTSTDHSTSDQDYQCRELLSAMEPTMSGSRDGERTSLLNNGSSMRSQRQSRITTGSLIHLKSKAMVALQMPDALVLTLDGGNYSDLMELSLETSKTIKYWMSKVELTERIRTSCGTLLTER
jgi:hypothetical protein